MTIPFGYPFASLGNNSFVSVGRHNGGQGSLYVSRRNLSNRDLAILNSLANFRFMTTKQIEALHFDGNNNLTSARTSRRVLERLTTNHIIRRLNRRIGGLHAGSSSFIYALTPKGANLIGTKPSHSFEPSTLFLDHTLLIADIYVQLLKQTPLEVLSFETEPNCWRVIRRNQILKPDLWLKLATSTEEIHWFLEVDRSTEHRLAIQSKLKLYYEYFLTGQEQDKSGLFPRVLWLVPDNDRKQWLEALIRPYESQIPGLFIIATYDDSMNVLRGNGYGQ